MGKKGKRRPKFDKSPAFTQSVREKKTAERMRASSNYYFGGPDYKYAPYRGPKINNYWAYGEWAHGSDCTCDDCSSDRFIRKGGHALTPSGINEKGEWLVRNDWGYPESRFDFEKFKSSL